MQSDDDLQTTLSKWPFILGDVLLVATALAIAILGHWQLTNWQVASCVISVALGAGLFVLPYIVEFQVRVREEAEDRTADLRILQRHVVSTQEQLEAVADRIESIEAGLSNLAQAKPDLSAPIEALESKIDPLNRQQAEQASQLEALVEQVDLLAKSIESKTDAEAIQALKTELAALQTKVEELPALEAPQPKEAPAEGAKPKEVAPVEPITKKTREPRSRRTPEPRLLKRAIEQKQDNSSAAVSRIIESKSKKPPVTEAAAAEPIPEESPKSEPKLQSVEELNGSEPQAIEPEESKVEVVQPEAPEAPEPKEPYLEPEAWDETAVEKPKEAEPVPESELTEPEDMFSDAVPVEVKKRMRTKKSDTAVIASVFIGIGNKPFVRGSGAGLSWDSGIAMEFEEIGKWRWIAPAELEEPVEIQLYRNDDDPDRTGKYTLEPGQQLDLSPVFN